MNTGRRPNRCSFEKVLWARAAPFTVIWPSIRAVSPSGCARTVSASGAGAGIRALHAGARLLPSSTERTVTALIGKRLGGAPTDGLRLPHYPTTPPTAAMPRKRSSLFIVNRLDSNQSGLSQAHLAPNTLQYKGKWARSGTCGICRLAVPRSHVRVVPGALGLDW